MPTLRHLIAASRTAEELEQFDEFSPSDVDIKLITETGVEVLKVIPPTPGACVLMSAVHATLLENRLSGPAFVVAGSLSVADTPVFGNAEPPANLNAVFNDHNLSWDGHCWIAVADLIVDVSVFRTAYSPQSPPALKDHVIAEFGAGRGLMVAKPTGTGKLVYAPQYVLTQDQTDALFRGARAMFGGEARANGRRAGNLWRMVDGMAKRYLG